jgi:hypothetical protein
MREFTQQELQAVMQAEQQLREKGLIVDNDGGKEAADHNSERVSAFFELNTHIPVTVESVVAACQQMRDQLKFKSPAQMVYEKEYQALSPSDQNAFGAWWHSPSTKMTIVIEGDEGYSNAAHIIQWTKGRSFDNRNLDLAVSNLTATQGLHLAPIREQVSSGRPGHTSDGKGLFSKSDTNLSARDHQKLAQEAADKNAGRTTPTSGTNFQAAAEAVLGRSHSQTANIQRLFVTGPDGKINWEATLAGRRRVAGL